MIWGSKTHLTKPDLRAMSVSETLIKVIRGRTKGLMVWLRQGCVQIMQICQLSLGIGCKTRASNNFINLDRDLEFRTEIGKIRPKNGK